MPPVQRFLDLVQEKMTAGMSLSEAVRHTGALNPSLWLDVLETIGMWPASDPILKEAQRQFR